MDKDSVGRRIKQQRLKSGLSQVDLAKRIGVSKQTLYKYENDIITNIPSDKIEAIADCLGVTASSLMGWQVNSLGLELFPIYKQSEHLALYVELLKRHEITKLLDSAKNCTPGQIKIATDMLNAFNAPGEIPVLKKEDEDGRT